MDTFDNSSVYSLVTSIQRKVFILSFSLPVLAPPPVPVSQPLQDALCKKVQVSPFWPYRCPPSLSSWLPHPQTKGAEQMARALPQRLPRAHREESGRGSAHSEQAAALTPATTGCLLLPGGCSSPSKPRVPSPEQQALCLPPATFGMHEHGCRQRGGGSLRKAQWLRRCHLTSLPSSGKPLP